MNVIKSYVAGFNVDVQYAQHLIRESNRVTRFEMNGYLCGESSAQAKGNDANRCDRQNSRSAF